MASLPLSNIKLTDITWDDRCACYWAAYEKLDPETKACIQEWAETLRDQVKGENCRIQLSDKMALALVAEACVRVVLKYPDAPINFVEIEEKE